MTVLVKGVVAVREPKVSCIPGGSDVTVTGTVRGSSRRVTVVVRPLESRAVSRSSRYEGYSWSGAVMVPPDTPVQVCRECVWQADGQCCRTISQVSALAGRAPSSGSVAEPEKLIGVPTCQVVPVAGDAITGCGGDPPAVQPSRATASPAAS